MRRWHYYPVWTEDANGRRIYGLCEVYVTEDDTLISWTDTPHLRPLGADEAALEADLRQMAEALATWEPVNHADLANLYRAILPRRRHA